MNYIGRIKNLQIFLIGLFWVPPSGGGRQTGRQRSFENNEAKLPSLSAPEKCDPHRKYVHSSKSQAWPKQTRAHTGKGTRINYNKADSEGKIEVAGKYAQPSDSGPYKIKCDVINYRGYLSYKNHIPRIEPGSPKKKPGG